jgi:hypothetical protein
MGRCVGGAPKFI